MALASRERLPTPVGMADDRGWPGALPRCYGPNLAEQSAARRRTSIAFSKGARPAEMPIGAAERTATFVVDRGSGARSDVTLPAVRSWCAPTG